ncbi:Arylsulfatase [Pontiella desulfatans]|uniref:Arylsulfatase n=1 Tax=Pontiella desulfatans TaxID=2750659 RepID=A0A6C2U1R5_PONDE|nr:sulfatase [Pontiella desulfatans]SPS73819.1 sulfatase S1_36 [Kiritimatiellales bacterium]VGO13531.1 Arylsulfatase [Pontiella desulfatans]
MNRLSKAVVLLLVFAGAVSAAKEKPNFLFVMVDDMAPDAIFHNRFDFLETPNLQRLADEGAVFNNMFVTTSLCSPSRASILTGTYSHIHGVRYNEIQDPEPHLEQFPQTLQKIGYKTALIGKWHMAHHARPRPGFDYWLSFKGQGVYNNPELNINGDFVKQEGYITDILTDKAVDFISENKNDPFCVLLWHKACHAKFTPAERHKDAFPDAKIKEPESWSLDFSEKPTWMRREKIFGPHYKKWVASEGLEVPAKLSPQKWAPPAQWLDMLRCMLAVDEGVGRVMDLLEKQGRLDNTVIIFMADNGWFYGEHRRGDKRLAYEESIRVPFAMRYPAKLKAGKSIDGMVANIDIGPTILELAGAQTPKTMQGESFVPVMEGKAEGRTDPFFYVYFQEKYAPAIPTTLSIRTPEWKYIHLPYESAAEGNVDELYRLGKDPNELKNLIHSPEAAAQLKKMQQLLANAMEQYEYSEPPYKYEPPQKDE